MRILHPCGVLALGLIAVSSIAAETPETILERSRGVLAQIEGRMLVPGIKEPVEVLRDQWGVPHIYARNQDDLFFAQGFVAAQDRLFQIDLWRRVAVGETAELLGPQGVAGDRFARLVKYRGDMAAEWSSYSPDAEQIATAFTRGINAYIDQIGDRLPIEFTLLGARPKKWRPEDCLGRMSGIIMVNNFRNEIARAELTAAVGHEKTRRLLPPDPQVDYAPAPGFDLAGINRSVLEGYTAATATLKFNSPTAGSNNWVVDGSLSASGKPLLANDPHRPVLLPSLRYLVHLNAPGWDVIGGGEPALPGVAIGHNPRIAWGMTIVGNDQADVYVEQTNPENSRQYKVGDRWEQMTIVFEEIVVRGEARPTNLELRFTRHGPVIHQDELRQRAFALRWAGSEPGTAGYLGCLALDRAGNWQEFRRGAKAWKLPSENLVYADVDGNIGWIASALTPVRKGWHGLLPVPGVEGKYEWQGFLDVDDYPQTFNPASHRVATANHNILPNGYRHEISYEWTPRYRFERVKQRLDAQDRFSMADFQSIQHDNTTLPGQALARLVRRVDQKETNLAPYVTLLAEWDGVLTAESRAGPLYAVWLSELLEAFFGRHVPAALVETTRSSRTSVPVLLAALESPDEFWFGSDAERDRLLTKTLAAAVRKVQDALSADSSQWSWGKLHTTTLRHPLASMGPSYEKAFNLGPLPRAGDGLTPNANSHNARFEHIAGASYREVFDLADWDRGVATSVPGQSGQPGSPHYADLLPLWSEGRYFPLAYSRQKVETVTKHRLQLTPPDSR